ncbi:MAG: ferrous iron transport protein A [Candidatus Aenigmatarchaeota archaeon]
MEDKYENYVKLAEFPLGEEGEITEIYGGRGLWKKLNGRGIIPGRTVKKTLEQGFGGPVLLEVEGDSNPFAIGRGIAEKIEVGYDDETD